MKDVYQKTYENGVGSAMLSKHKLTAGSLTDITLTYTVGSLGIDDSGSLKVLFRIVSDCGEPQFVDPEEKNYVKISSSNKDVIIVPSGKTTGLIGKIDVRPWSKGIVLHVTNTYLEEGDTITLNFKKWQVQSFCQKKFGFKIVVDPFASAKYIELPNYPAVEIVPDAPTKLVTILPSRVKINQSFQFLIKLEDKWGNPCINKDGRINIDPNPLFSGLPEKAPFEKGRALLKAYIKKEGITTLVARYGSMSAISNPIEAVVSPETYLYWADLHGQSDETVGTNDITDYFDFAKEYAFLQVTCPQNNDLQIDNPLWKKINAVSKKFTKDNQFIVIPGYEWSGNTSVGGDRNVLYLKESMPLIRSSHALVADMSDLKDDAVIVTDLFKKLPKRSAMTIAHVGGRYANLAMHDDSIERNVEVHSDWGTFEWFFFDALERNYKVGVVANSDCHDGRPGASYPSLDHFNSYGGLTGIFAQKLDRKNIFEALYNRHCYATTGTRMVIDAQLTIDNRSYMPGDEIKTKKFPTVDISVMGTAPIEKILIYNKSSQVDIYMPPIKSTSPKKVIKIMWSGSRTKGRGRNFVWNGNLTIDGNRIENVEKINFFNQKNFVKHNPDSLQWQGNTTGGIQGVIVTMSSNIGALTMTVNEKKITIPVIDINQKGTKYEMGGLDAVLKVYETTQMGEGEIQTQHSFKLPILSKGNNAVFAKVIQRDGHMAWTSPFFINS